MKAISAGKGSNRRAPAAERSLEENGGGEGEEEDSVADGVKCMAAIYNNLRHGVHTREAPSRRLRTA